MRAAIKHFLKTKSHSLNAAHDQITSLDQKKITSHGNFTHFCCWVKTPFEQNSTSGKKKP